MIHKYENDYNRVILKPLKISEIEALRVLRNSNRKNFLYDNIISKEEQEAWFEDYLKKDNDYMFSIYLKNSPCDFIGACALYNIQIDKGIGEFGRIVVDKNKTNLKGIGYDALISICDIAFEILHLDKITLEVYSDNISALKTYLKANFKIITESKHNNRILLNMELKKENKKWQFKY